MAKISFGLVFFVLFLSTFQCFAKNGDEHVADMCMAFPFDVDRSPSIKKLYRYITTKIDLVDENGKISNRPRCIKNHPIYGGLKWSNHRLFYHWGFDGSWQDVTYFQKDCFDYWLMNGTLDNAQITQLKHLIERDWRSVKSGMLDESSRVLRYSVTSNKLHAWVSLMYSVHILGDFATTETSIIVPKEILYRDIYSSLKTLSLGGDRKNVGKYEKIVSYLKQYEEDPSLFLAAMQNKRHGIGHYIESLSGGSTDYQRYFKKFGIYFK